MKTTFDGMEMEFSDGQPGHQVAGYDPVRTPYEIRETDFPYSGSLEEQELFLLHYAVLAPSTHNTQPWKFAVTPDTIEVYADYTRRMPVVDTASRELLMSIGAALFNLRVAAAHFGMACRVDYNLSGDSERPLAVVSLGPPKSGDADGLGEFFKAIPLRHTNRSPFLLSRVPAAVMERLARVANDSRVEFVLSTDGSLNTKIGDLVARAEQMQWGDTGFRKDLAEWIRPDAAPEGDGIPGQAYGWHGTVAALGSYAARTIDQGRLRAARDRNLCLEAPGLIVVTSEDLAPYLMEAGEVLERLLLTIVIEDLQYSYFNMPVQVPDFRTELKGLLGCALWPQLLLRVGYCLTPPAVTPRRPLEDALLHRRTV